jgi:hypothetical protein
MRAPVAGTGRDDPIRAGVGDVEEPGTAPVPGRHYDPIRTERTVRIARRGDRATDPRQLPRENQHEERPNSEHSA